MVQSPTREERLVAASPVTLRVRAKVPRKPRRRPGRRDNQWERFNQLGAAAGSRPALSRDAAVGDEPLHPGRRKVGGFGLPKSPIREQLDGSGSSTGGSSMLGPRWGQSKLEDALHRVSNTWLLSESESDDGGDDGWLSALADGSDDVNNWQGSRPVAPAWEPLSDQLEDKAAAAAKDEQQRHEQDLRLQQQREEEEERAAKARAISEGAAWIAGVVHQRRPTSAPPPSSAAWQAKHRPTRPSSASVRQDDSATQFEAGLTVSALELRRTRRRRKQPLPAFKDRPTRLVCKPAPAPQRLLPGRAELLGGGWSRVEPFEAKHPCYFWHGRWKRGSWGHPMEPEPLDEEGLAAQLMQAQAYGQAQEVLRLERVAQLAGFRAGGALSSP